MNLEDYFDMLNKMAKRNPQPSHGRRDNGSSNHAAGDETEEDEDPLPPEEASET